MRLASHFNLTSHPEWGNGNSSPAVYFPGAGHGLCPIPSKSLIQSGRHMYHSCLYFQTLESYFWHSKETVDPPTHAKNGESGNQGEEEMAEELSM